MRLSCYLIVWLMLGSFVSTSSAQTTSKPQSNKSSVEPSSKHVHAKDAHGPHGGEIIEVGKEDIHLEVCVDEIKNELVLYVLGLDLKTPVPMEMEFIIINAKAGNKPVQFKVAAVAQKGEPLGKTSCFRIVSDSLVQLLHDTKSEPRISMRYQNKSYSLKIPHDHHHAHSGQGPTKGKQGLKR